MRLEPAFALLALSLSASAQTSPPAATASAPVVVELFTSQSCSSCPPAEAYFRELAGRPGLIALEWHVDYWDDLRVGKAGKWKDPYSSPAWTGRQRAYNKRFTGAASAYTPQAVIGGAKETTGFNRGAIEGFIRDAAKATPAARISATRGPDIRFAVEGAPKSAEALLVTYRLGATTDVKGGENNGRKLSSAHLVVSAKKLAPGPSLATSLPAENEGCALLLTEPNQGRILAAAACPK